MGEHPEAVAALTRAKGLLALAEHARGKTDEARKLLAELAGPRRGGSWGQAKALVEEARRKAGER